jgi:hypothetical protein
VITIEKLRYWLFTALIVFAPFSFIPSFSLPLANFTSFRIGGYQLLALAFVMLCIREVINDYITRKHTKEDRYVYGSILILCAASAYLLTDALEPARSLLMTVSFCFLLVLVLSARWYVSSQKSLFEKLLPLIAKMGIFYGAVSLLQLTIATLSPDTALLCKGCGSQVFGFSRINGFAAEPLFWANALLSFWIISLYSYTKQKTRLHLVALSLVTCSIVLTFARGAYFAIAVVVVLYFVHKRTIENARVIIVLGAVSILSMGLLVLSSVVQNRSSDGVARETLSGILEHLSFGRLSVAEQATMEAEQAPAQNDFDSAGYVEASTNDRTGSADLALRAWQKPSNTLFGVGLGNLGPYVVSTVDASAPSNLTVYIYYILLLAELGIVGIVLVVGLYVQALLRLWKTGALGKLFGLILVGFLVHYFFFGSYINVVYIWLWLGIGLGYHSTNGKNKQKVISTVS